MRNSESQEDPVFQVTTSHNPHGEQESSGIYTPTLASRGLKVLGAGRLLDLQHF